MSFQEYLNLSLITSVVSCHIKFAENIIRQLQTIDPQKKNYKHPIVPNISRQDLATGCHNPTKYTQKNEHQKRQLYRNTSYLHDK